MIKKEYQVCNKCVMDTTDEEITFNEMGICNHCIEFDNLLKKWTPNGYGKHKLDSIIEKIKLEGKNNKFDCVIGLSGGVDSSYLAYMLRRNYPDLRILAVHVDGGWNSELAVHNIENIVKKLNISLYTGVVPWNEMRDLQLAYFKSQLANQDVPQDHVFFATLYKVALENNIRYFLTGGNYSTESILPKSWGYNPMDGKQLKYIHNKFGKIKLREYEVISFFKRMLYYPFIQRLKIIRPLDFIKYNKDEAKEEIMKELDWRDYGGKHHESKFTKFFQAYWLPKKFGYDKRKAHYSSLILAGQMTRESALTELKKPIYNDKNILSDKEYISKKLGISVEEFNSIMNKPNMSYLDYPNEVHYELTLSKIINYFKRIIKLK
jgi:N-acetyl sugar amidotransferase